VDSQCGIRLTDGSPCPILATHDWGNYLFCCVHYTQHMTALLDISIFLQARLMEQSKAEFGISEEYMEKLTEILKRLKPGK
jgi:hypothetical protein